MTTPDIKLLKELAERLKARLESAYDPQVQEPDWREDDLCYEAADSILTLCERVEKLEATSKITDEQVEMGAKKLAEWIHYSWDGCGERDISAEYPDWTSDGGMQGGKPALRKIARSILKGEP
jgi:hypothetical protein